MKALTVCQPYAELIARGEKVIENRTWPTSYRGPLLIHAGQSRAWLDLNDHPKANYGIDITTIPFGAAVALVDLVDCRRVADLPPSLIDHEHAHGPWCWVLANVRRLPEPVPMRGAQGLWVPDLANRKEPADV
jgi:hypothetical protein